MMLVPRNTLHQTGKAAPAAPYRPEPWGRQPREELRLTTVRALLFAVTLLFLMTAAADQHFTAARENMIHTIQALAKTVSLASSSGEIDESVLNAMREVPRHELVPEAVRHAAYENRPLPNGHGQTISQPYIVALMTNLANPAQ